MKRCWKPWEHFGLDSKRTGLGQALLLLERAGYGANRPFPGGPQVCERKGRCLLIFFLPVYLSFCVGFDVWKSCEGKPLRTIEKVIFFCVHALQNSFLPHDPRPVVPDLRHTSKKKRIRQTAIQTAEKESRDHLSAWIQHP